MLPNWQEKLSRAVDGFNAQDEECYRQLIPNDQAKDWLSCQIPMLDCPDEALEQVYYFRWWTIRKHFRETPVGHIMTEFLPDVTWAGPYNSINCAAAHHVRETRWLKDDQGWVKEYIRFWLDGHGQEMSYSMWLASSVEEYCVLRGDEDFAGECLPKLVRLYRRREQDALQKCGLYWSNDNRDGMEYSISGAGLRPTMNSYMYGDAMAISRLAKKQGDEALSAEFAGKAASIKEAVDRLLWKDGFYRTIPCEKGEDIGDVRPEVPEEHNVREEVGYIPWYFGLPDPGKEEVFADLLQPDGFYAPWGLTTARQDHPRFMFTWDHECLWNGPVWPYATSQTLTAAARLLREYPATEAFTREDYWHLLRQYALSHRIRRDGKYILWIDEVMDPYTGDWIARTDIKNDHWNPKRGGYERGKDYNHSTFCDLVLSGLLGIGADRDGRLTADPLIPSGWNWFCVTGIPHDGALWTVLYDRDGSHYHEGTGLIIRKEA